MEEPYQQLVQLTQLYIDALKRRVEGIEENNASLKKESEEVYRKYIDMVKGYHQSMEKLATTYQFNYEPLHKDALKDRAAFVEKQQAIIRFINEDVIRMSAYEQEAGVYMQAVSGDNYTDDSAMYKALMNEIIPLYEKVVKEAKSIEPEIEALEKPLDLLIQATLINIEALKLRAESLRKQDREMLKASEDTYFEYQDALKQYHKILGELAKDYNVIYEPGVVE